jgi:maltose O-acetyltransferase
VSDQKQRMLRGELYIATDPELAADHERCRLLVERFNGSSVTEIEERRALLERLLGSIGDETVIRPPLQCDYGYQIHIGSRSFVNYGSVMLDVAEIRIGNEVQIATNVQLLTATHPLEASVRRKGWEYAKPISIANGVWLGGGAIVCPGIHIGENTVVGAGSVVTRDLPAGVLAVGNPCRVIRELTDSEMREG